LGLLVDTYATTAGPAAGLELGYAFPAGQHAFAVGFGADFVMGLSRGDGDHGYYKDRDYLLMPEVSLRFLL
jgi:hypothetical protein